MKQYVQHISGKGEKWEVCSRCAHGWNIYGSNDKYRVYYVPDIEYALCDPPEEWEDVTAECEEDVHVNGFHVVFHKMREGSSSVKGDNYRIRKIDHIHNGPAFIIERKNS